jgi:PAS domain S-box-containing protein
MFDSTVIITVIIIYIALLFGIARWGEKRQAGLGGGVVYALSLAVYCTAWTYYGSVGKAASSGMLFITIFIGPTLCTVLWWSVLRKLVRIKHRYRINSIADFIAARYNNSHLLAALVTCIALLGNAPYIALQFKAVISTFELVSRSPENTASVWVSGNIGLIVVILMILFTIAFGVRRLDPTERHQGMVMAVAAESLVKLLTFLAAGIFITYVMFGGFDDLIGRIHQVVEGRQLPFASGRPFSFATWFTYLILGMTAILCLPRQFHIAVVENSDERQILTAMWLFPLYILLINIFVIPIAIAGFLKGLPLSGADTYVIALPILSGHPILPLLVFLGGFSAATSMIMISAMTLSTMVTNHLCLPCIELFPALAGLRRRILQMRWLVVTLVISMGYWFEQKLGGSYTLVNMGMISFAAAMQFAPAIIGGIYWPKGNRCGAILGLGSGFVLWFYTLLVPSFARSGWLSMSLLDQGPQGIALLRPEALLGLVGLDPLAHGVFWTMFCNIGLYVIGSLLYQEDDKEKDIAAHFVGILQKEAPAPSPADRPPLVDIFLKMKKIKGLLNQYMEDSKAAELVERCVASCGLLGREKISVLELSHLCHAVEKQLAGSIGTIAAGRTFQKLGEIFDAEEEKELANMYRTLLAEMNLSPEELREKVDYYQEREALISAHAAALEEKVRELEENIRERRKAELARREVERQYVELVEESPDAIVSLSLTGMVLSFNPEAERISGYRADEVLGRHFASLPFLDADSLPVALNEFALLVSESERRPVDYGIVGKDGKKLIVEAHSRLIRREGKKVSLQMTLRDITERRKIESEVRYLQNYLENIVNSMPSILVGVDAETNITLWNQKAEQSTGLAMQDVKGKKLADVYPQLSRELDKIKDVFTSNKVRKAETMLNELEGEKQFCEITVYPLTTNGVIGAVIRVDDVTDRVRMEEILIQSEKMLSVGGLAAGMAHEINNPLAGIMQNMQVIRNRLSPALEKNQAIARECGVSLEALEEYMKRREMPEMLDNIKESVQRAARIVSNMLSFSRSSLAEKAEHDIAELLDLSVELAENDYSLKKNYDFRKIAIIREYQQGVPLVTCEASKIQQVFLNILNNGAHAMYETRNERPSQFILRVMSERDMVRVEIEDNGPGMTDSVRRRIFEPFFTTKKVGLGTGLGLSVSYFIITEHHEGTLHAESSPGRGARFIIRLPVGVPRAAEQ